MNIGRTVFSQLMDFIPVHEFRSIVKRHHGEHRFRSFSCWEQFLCMAFAQLTYRESLRDIETCLRSPGSKLYHCGIRSRIARSTLADANRFKPGTQAGRRVQSSDTSPRSCSQKECR